MVRFVCNGQARPPPRIRPIAPDTTHRDVCAAIESKNAGLATPPVVAFPANIGSKQRIRDNAVVLCRRTGTARSGIGRGIRAARRRWNDFGRHPRVECGHGRLVTVRHRCPGGESSFGGAARGARSCRHKHAVLFAVQSPLPLRRACFVPRKARLRPVQEALLSARPGGRFAPLLGQHAQRGPHGRSSGAPGRILGAGDRRHHRLQRDQHGGEQHSVHRQPGPPDYRRPVRPRPGNLLPGPCP